MSSPYTIVITGANRGIGRALVDKLHAKHPNAKIIVTVRSGAAGTKAGLDKLSHVSLVYIDFEKFDTIRAGAKKIAELAPEGIDELWNNAGVMGGPTDSFTPDVDPELVTKELVVNTVSPIFFTTQLLSLLDKKDTKRVIFVGSIIGAYNIWSKPQPVFEPIFFATGYAASKAGIAFAAMGFAALQKPRGYIVVGIHPGLVDTDMSAGVTPAPGFEKITTEDSASQMIESVYKRTKDDKYHFIGYDGSVLDEGTPF